MKPQAGQSSTLSTHETVPVPVTDINAISAEISQATNDLFVLLHEVPGFTAAMAE